MHRYSLLTASLLCFCLGCGSSDYQSRIAKRAGAAPASLVGPAEQIPGTRVSVCVPRGMTLLPPGTDPKRMNSIPFPAPGSQQRVYEGFVADSVGGQTPFYCYILTLELPKNMPQNFMNLMKNAPTKSGKPMQFTECQTTSPEGVSSTWQVSHESDKDDFYYKQKDGTDKLQSMAAVGDLYIREEAGYFVFLAWRVPSSIEKSVADVGLAELAKAFAGGVTVRAK